MDKSHNKIVFTEGWLSICINILLFGLKYAAGYLTGSVAIIADAWHTLSDSISSIILLVGNKISTKPADERHPFGHGRAELITSIFIGVLLAIIAFNFFKESIIKLRAHEETVYGTLAIVATIVSIVLKEVLAQYAFWAARKTKLLSLKADGWHHRSDAISSVIILAGLFLGKMFWWIDGVLGIIVSVMIFYAAFEILKSGINPLMGEKPDPGIEQAIIDICNSHSLYNLIPHHFHLHEYGLHKEVTFHILFPPTLSIKEAHTITSTIENTIREKLNIEATIHLEPNES